MKRFVSVILVLMLIIACSIAVSADQIDIEPKTEIEYFADGSYTITVLEETNSLARAAKSGQKTKTYYTSNDEPVFSVTVTGTFSYTYGVSAAATKSSGVVTLYMDEASLVSKSATYRNATAYASGTVSYLGLTRAMTVDISCDKYGNLS